MRLGLKLCCTSGPSFLRHASSTNVIKGTCLLTPRAQRMESAKQVTMTQGTNRSTVLTSPVTASCGLPPKWLAFPGVTSPIIWVADALVNWSQPVTWKWPNFAIYLLSLHRSYVPYINNLPGSADWPTFPSGCMTSLGFASIDRFAWR